MSKEQFKLFVKKHPGLVNHVNNNEMSWQKFYELYDIYGEDNDIWNNYIGNKKLEETSFKDIFDYIKNLDLDNVKKNIDGISKIISLFQDLALGKNISNNDEYKKRPVYKNFED